MSCNIPNNSQFLSPQVTHTRARTKGARGQQEAQAKCKFAEQQEQEAIRTARGEGYIRAVSSALILNNSFTATDDPPAMPSEVYSLELQKRRLEDISMLDLCVNLEICDLSRNFIRSIEPLRWCANLISLDLHSNRIARLPDYTFWQGMRKLSSLYLRDNGIHKLQDVKALSHAPQLKNLTLQDTPVSLKKNYRHCVVNAIFSLSALDGYVISDEEIIEDADFPARYKPKQGQFHVRSPYLNRKRVCCIDNHGSAERMGIMLSVEENVFTGETKSRLSSKNKLPYSETLNLVWRELSQINAIQSKWCPVLVLQRVTRGYLTRLRYEYALDTRLWAAVTIQRCYRKWKGARAPQSATAVTAPAFPVCEISELSSIKLNYENYLKVRRSKGRSLLSIKSYNFQVVPSLSAYAEQVDPLSSLQIDLDKLHLQTDDLLARQQPDRQQSDRQQTDMLQADRWSNGEHSAATNDGLLDNDYYNSETLTKQPKVRFLGMVNSEEGVYCREMIAAAGKLPSSAKQFFDNGQPMQVSERDEIWGFRLRVQRAPVMEQTRVEEMRERRVEDAEEMRYALQRMRDAVQRRKKRRANRKLGGPSNALTHQERRMLKSQTTMNVNTFRAVEQAYADHKDASEHVYRVATVKHQKEKMDESRETRRKFRRRYTAEACVQNQADQAMVTGAVTEQEEQQLDACRAVAARRRLERERKRRLKEDRAFALNFSQQSVSIAHALRAHEHRERRKDRGEQTFEKVQTQREVSRHNHNAKSAHIEASKRVKLSEALDTKVNTEYKLAQVHTNREWSLEEKAAMIEQKRQEDKRAKSLGTKGVKQTIILPKKGLAVDV